jgi:TetR/AcrR family transcriptional regulator, cholesterol catabolism regulator
MIWVALAAQPGSDGNRAGELRRVASDLFFSKGYEATTTREIAGVLGIKSASIYYHYENKEEILFDVIRSTMTRLTDGLRAMLERESDPASQLAGLVANHVTMHALWPRETTLGDTELRSLTGERREEIVALRDRYEQLVVQVIENGRRAKVFDVLDPKLTAYAVIAQSSNVGNWYRAGGRVSLEDVVYVYANLALRLAKAPDVSRTTVRRVATAAKRLHAEAAS